MSKVRVGVGLMEFKLKLPSGVWWGSTSKNIIWDILALKFDVWWQQF